MLVLLSVFVKTDKWKFKLPRIANMLLDLEINVKNDVW